jgi:hypothetical protein
MAIQFGYISVLQNQFVTGQKIWFGYIFVLQNHFVTNKQKPQKCGAFAIFNLI